MRSTRRTTASAVTKLTYYHYALTPEDKRYELIDGELYMTPAPVPFHQIVSRRIENALSSANSPLDLRNRFHGSRVPNCRSK